MVIESTEKSTRLYRSPGAAAVAAYVCVALTLFFAGLNLKTHADLRKIEKDLLKLAPLGKRVSDLEKENSTLRRQLELLGQRVVASSEGVTSPVDSLSPQSQPHSVVSEKPRSKKSPVGGGRKPKAVASAAIKEEPALPRQNVAVLVSPQLEKTLRKIKVASTSPTKTKAAKSLMLRNKVKENIATKNTRKKVVSSIQETAAVSGLRAKVVATYSRKHRVLLSLGATNGLERGKRFLVSRGGRVVAQIRVAQVFQYMSMCEIIGGVARDGVRVGDVAQAVTADQMQ